MKRNTSYILAKLAILATLISLFASCKKDETVDNTNAKIYFDAWLQVHHPGAQKSGRGIYIIEDTPGTGTEITSTELDSYYVYVRFTSTDLDGNISSTTDEDVAKRTGDYSVSTYYGPTIWQTGATTVPAGIQDLLKGMKIGGTRTAIIPGWLTEAKDYDTEEEYLNHCSGSSVIYTVTLCDVAEDIVKWEIKKLEEYKVENMADVDSTIYGLYSQTVVKPVYEYSLQKDTTIYVNYIGRLLSGKVFDTTIADTAKVYGIYSESNTYEPVKITMAEEYSNISMGSDNSSVVTGFAYGLWLLRPYEKTRCAFTSGYGYSSSGSSPSIPAYCPLVFDLEVVDEP